MANKFFKVAHELQTDAAEDSDTELDDHDGDFNNNSEYAQLVSMLESCDKHMCMWSESADVLEGVACASLSLDIMHLTKM